MKDIPSPSTTNWQAVYDCLEVLRARKTPGSIYESMVRSEDAEYISWVLSALAPWVLVQERQPATAGAKVPPPWGALAAKEGFRAENKICNLIAGAFKHRGEITTLKDAISRKETSVQERDTLGMAIREWDARGGNWRLQALFALLAECIQMEKPTGMCSFHTPAGFVLLIIQNMNPSSLVGRAS